MSRSVQINNTIDERVQELERKAERIADSRDTDSRVETASSDINRVCNRIDRVVDSGEELVFYVRLYEGTFGEERPGTVVPKVQSALEKIDIADDELLTAAKEKRLTDIEAQVEDAEKQINTATDEMQEVIREEQETWINDLESAEELNKIIGGDSGFQNLIENMKRFLKSQMWNTTKDPSQLKAQWERYERKWEENAGKHGWETFQSDHDIDESTVEELKQFSDDDPVRLSDLSLHTLEEIKRVPDLESALQIEVRS